MNEIEQLKEELRLERGRRAAAEDARNELNVKLNAIGGGSITRSETEECCWRSALIALDLMKRHGLMEEWSKATRFIADFGIKNWRLEWEDKGVDLPHAFRSHVGLEDRLRNRLVAQLMRAM